MRDRSRLVKKTLVETQKKIQSNRYIKFTHWKFKKKNYNVKFGSTTTIERFLRLFTEQLIFLFLFWTFFSWTIQTETTGVKLEDQMKWYSYDTKWNEFICFRFVWTECMWSCVWSVWDHLLFSQNQTKRFNENETRTKMQVMTHFSEAKKIYFLAIFHTQCEVMLFDELSLLVEKKLWLSLYKNGKAMKLILFFVYRKTA